MFGTKSSLSNIAILSDLFISIFFLTWNSPFLTCPDIKINHLFQGRSQNLKEVFQIFKEVFNIDYITANDVIERNQHRK